MSPRGQKPQGLRFKWEKELRASDLSTKARHVGHVMATYANIDGTSVPRGITLLAKGAGAPRRIGRRPSPQRQPSAS